MTPDIDAAQAFYAQVIGWRMWDSGLPAMRYTLAGIGDRPVAGLMAPPADAAGAPAMWFGYILVDDVDGMAGRVLEAGGAIHRPPADIPGVGRFSVVADPQGAVFMLFRGDGPAPPDPAPGTPGRIGWHELRTADWPSAFGFYQALFGWEKDDTHDMGPRGTYQTFSIDGARIGGMMDNPQPARSLWSYTVAVDGIDAAAARVTAAGGVVESGPHPVPGGSWVLHARDPQGARFAMVGPREG